MLTLDEAIKHCEEKAKELREQVDTHKVVDAEEIGDCIECANEHEQLAGWLTELKKVRDICEHWSDDSSSFVSACNSFEDILHIFKMGVGDKENDNETDN